MAESPREPDAERADEPTDAAERTRAVAVKQEDEERLPRITASGRGVVAERILDIAFEEGVKVRQDRELTEILEVYDIDSPIPLEALGAVSEILRHVYAENTRMAAEVEKNDARQDNNNEGADT